MLEQMEGINRRVWEGHSRLFEDRAHVLAGIGIGLLIFPRLGSRLGQHVRSVGLALIGISVLMHLYAYLTPGGTPVGESGPAPVFARR